MALALSLFPRKLWQRQILEADDVVGGMAQIMGPRVQSQRDSSVLALDP